MGSPVPTTEEWIERASALHQYKYDYSKVIYTRATAKVQIICPIHGEFEQLASSHIRGEGCRKCAIERRSKKRKKGIIEFITDARAIHGDKFDYAKAVYKNATTKLIITCPEHGDFLMSPSLHTHSKQGCPKCAGKNRSVDDLIAKFRDIHGEKYDYSNVRSVRVYDQIEIICKHHGPFTQTVKHHLRGLGCSKCSGVYSPSTHEWVERAQLVWGTELYDYSEVEYNDAHTPVKIKCNLHGTEFTQSPLQHLKSRGCQQCESEASRQMWMERYGVYHHKAAHISNDVLEKLNDFEWLKEQNQTKTLLEIASDLGVDNTTVQSRFYQHGEQPKYHTNANSAAERELFDLIASWGIEVIQNDRTVIHPKELDVYVPSKQLAIEFCGLYWHSDKFRPKNYHLDKLTECEKRGVTLITLYEDEWATNKDIVVKKLQRLLGVCTEHRVYARSCNVKELGSAEKRDFFNLHHIQGNGPGSTTYGLMHNGDIVAVVTFKCLGDGQYELNRYATSCNVIGGFTKLLAHFKRNHHWTSITTYADRRWSVGKLYTIAGFELDGITPPLYDYSYGLKRIHRSNLRKSALARKLGALYDPSKTEHENVTTHTNWVRIWNCGLMRFVLVNQLNDHVIGSTTEETRSE